MSLKNFILAGTASLVCTFGITTHADGGLANCVSTEVTQFDGTVVDAALATPELSTLVDALVAAGLVDALNDAENITVYAPTNDAFAAVPGDILDGILADIDVLTAVLTYHVSPSEQDPRRYATPVRTDSLQGQKLFFQRASGHARVNNSAVSCAGVEASNGLVWLIDSVLLPSF